MKRIGKVVMAGALLGLLGAGAEPTDSKVARLQAEVETLRKTNASLEQRLVEGEVEKARLRAELARVRSQAPSIVVPRSSEPQPVPPNAVPRGEGNVRHFVIPLELKPMPATGTSTLTPNR